MAANGSAQLRAISLHCKALGDRGLLNRTRKAIRVEAAPIIVAAKANARERLPRRGGLNEQVAGQRWTVQSLTGARTAGVRLKTKAPDTLQTDDGFVRHPVFGVWRPKLKPQQIPRARGWATDAVTHHGPAVAAGIARELNLAAAEVARAAGGS